MRAKEKFGLVPTGQFAIFSTLILVLSSFGVPHAIGQGNSILPNNYSRLPVGSEPGLQGGAVLARTNDPNANWYNPAGLAKATRPSISGNATLHDFTTISVDDGDANAGASSTGNFVGSVWNVGEQTASSGFSWGFSIVVPMQFKNTARSESTINEFGIDAVGLDDIDEPYYNLRAIESSSASISMLAPGLTIASKLTSNLRVGIGVRAYLLNMAINENWTYFQEITEPPFYNEVGDFGFIGKATLLSFEGGVQFDLSDTMTMGATIRTGSTTLNSSGLYSYSDLNVHDLDYNADGVTDSRVSYFAKVLDEAVSFNYNLPTEFGIGFAWTSPKWEIEIDIISYSEVAQFELVGSTERHWQYQDHDFAESGVETTDPTLESAQAISNIRIGGLYKINESYRLNFGYYDDLSPQSEGTFDRIDFVGLSFGLTKVTDKSATMIGLVSSTGTSAIDYETGTKLTNTNYRVSTIGLVLGGALYF